MLSAARPQLVQVHVLFAVLKLTYTSLERLQLSMPRNCLSSFVSTVGLFQDMHIQNLSPACLVKFWGFHAHLHAQSHSYPSRIRLGHSLDDGGEGRKGSSLNLLASLSLSEYALCMQADCPSAPCALQFTPCRAPRHGKVHACAQAKKTKSQRSLRLLITESRDHWHTLCASEAGPPHAQV